MFTAVYRSIPVWTVLIAVQALAQTGTMRGFADIHNHQFMNHALGGYTIAGKAYGPIQDALSESQCRIDLNGGHSKDHVLDVIGGYMAGHIGPAVHGNSGYPTFRIKGNERHSKATHERTAGQHTSKYYSRRHIRTSFDAR